MNFSNVRNNALKYLGYQGQIIDDALQSLLMECYQELTALADFKVTCKVFPLKQSPLTILEANLNISYPDLCQLFSACHHVIIIGCTLGIAVDRRSKYYSHIDMTRMTVFDALASSYLEALCDDYEHYHFPQNRTFRFCPGYGQTPISLNHSLAQLLDSYRQIGLSVDPHDNLLPQKSMIGLIGLGNKKHHKTCKHCINLENCYFRKRGQRCYKTD